MVQSYQRISGSYSTPFRARSRRGSNSGQRAQEWLSPARSGCQAMCSRSGQITPKSTSQRCQSSTRRQPRGVRVPFLKRDQRDRCRHFALGSAPGSRVACVGGSGSKSGPSDLRQERVPFQAVLPGGTSSRSVCRALRRVLNRGAKVRIIRSHLNKLEAWKRSRAIISFGSAVGAQGHNFCRRSRSRREPSLGPRSRPRGGLGGSRKLSEVCRKGWSQRSRSQSCLSRWRVAQRSRSSFF